MILYIAKNQIEERHFSVRGSRESRLLGIEISWVYFNDVDGNHRDEIVPLVSH